MLETMFTQPQQYSHLIFNDRHCLDMSGTHYPMM